MLVCCTMGKRQAVGPVLVVQGVLMVVLVLVSVAVDA
jgi:hypothetical protein